MAAAVPPLTDAVKKVDRAVARLEQLQSSIRAQNRSDENAQRVGREQLSDRQNATVGRQGLRLPAGKEGKRRQSGLGKAKVSSGFAKNGMPDFVEALSRRESISNKENAGFKKKWHKKSSMHGATDLAELPSPPSVGKPSPTRRVLENRQTNLLAVQKQFPSPTSSFSDTKQTDSKHAKASDKENRHCKVSDTNHNNGSCGRPPWKSVTVISTNNRYAATIAERVRPRSASIVAHHLPEGTSTRAGKREFPKDRKIQDGSSSLSASGRPITASVRPSPARENGTTGAAKRDFAEDRKFQDRSSLPASWRPIELETASIGPSPARENIDLTKSFCVDVRSAPNRPWSLATKLSNTTQPLVMFPNPAFRPCAQHRRVRDGKASAFSQMPRASPKLTPFKSRQLKPLELSSLQQPLFDPLPVTIRPYLSPSKTSPRQLRPRKVDPLDFLMDAKAQPAPSSSPPSTIRSTSSRKTTQQSTSLPLQKENLLRGRLSLPCSPSSQSFNKRFSLSESTKITNPRMNSAVTALPSLNTRLPARSNLASIDSIRITPPSRLAKSVSNNILATPLASPLPHPPTWRMLPARASNFSSGASSCLQTEHGMHNAPRFNAPFRTASSRAPQGILEPTQKNAPTKGSFRNSNSSLWPSITQKSSSYQQHSVDCTSNCAGTGPYLFRHVKRWMPSRTSGLSADKCPSIRT